MTHDEMAELYELYVLGALDEPAYSEIHRHLDEGCEHCSEQVSRAWRSTALLASLAETARPPVGLRRRVMSSVKPPSKPVRSWIWPAAWSAVSLVLLGLLLWSVQQKQNLHSTIDALISQRDDLRGQVQKLTDEQAQLRNRAQQIRSTAQALSDQQNRLQSQLNLLNRERNQARNRSQTLDATVAGLNGQIANLESQVQTLNQQRAEALNRAQTLSVAIQTLTTQVDNLRSQVQRLSNERNVLLAQSSELQSAVSVAATTGTKSLPFGTANDAPHGRVYLSPTGGVVFVGLRLPPLPPDRTFQLWLVPAKGAPQSAGVFRPDASGEAVHLAQTPNPNLNAAAVAVSVEPQGGSPAPTTKPIIVVPVNS